MSRTFAETLLCASLVTNAGLLLFIAGVLRKVMNDMDTSAFQFFLNSLVRHSKKSPFMLIVFNIPFIGAVPYFYFFGFSNRWLLAGLILWLVAGSIAKAIKLPIYKAVETLEASDTSRLREARHRMNSINVFQAVSNSVAVLLALVPFAR